MTIELGVIAAVSGIIFSYLGYRKGVIDEVKKESKTSSILASDIKYTRDRIDDVLITQKETNQKIDGMQERLIRVEESTKQAHKRIDDCSDKIERL